MKQLAIVKNGVGGFDLQVERDAGNVVRILTGNRSTEFWKELRDLADEVLTLSGENPEPPAVLTGCPKCKVGMGLGGMYDSDYGSLQIDYGILQVNGNTVWQECDCACGHSWCELYTYSGYELNRN